MIRIVLRSKGFNKIQGSHVVFGNMDMAIGQPPTVYGLTYMYI